MTTAHDTTESALVYYNLTGGKGEGPDGKSSPAGAVGRIPRNGMARPPHRAGRTADKIYAPDR